MDDERDTETSTLSQRERPRYARIGDAVLPAAVRRSYGAKFAVAVLLVVLLITSLGAASYVQTREIARVDAERTLQSTAGLHAESVGDWVASMTAETRGAAAWGVYRSADRSAIRAHLTRTLQRAGPHVVGLHYVDAETDTVTVSTAGAYEGRQVDAVSPTWWDAVDEVTATGEWTVSVADSAYDRDGDRRLAFAAPVHGGALVVVGDAPTDFARRAGSRTVLRTSVVTPGGETVFESAVADAAALAGTPEFAAAENGTGTLREHGDDVVAFAPVRGVDWRIVTAAPKTDLYQASRTVGRNVVVLVAASLATLVAVGFVLAHGTVTSLRRLRRRAEAMEAGDLDVDLRTHREDEIGRLYGAFDSMRAALRDQIREAEAARERAEQSRRDLARQNERLDQFASTVSHDLRNPLNVASGRLELAERRLDDLSGEAVDAVRSHLAKVADANRRMESIIGDVLALAREGRDIEDPESVALDAVARDAWATVDGGPAAFEVVTSRRLTADSERLQQALENLFRNAVEHGLSEKPETATNGRSSDTPADPPLRVEVGATDDGFYVADTGPGIPPDQVADIFEYGYTTEQDGTGFGLAIVETIIEAHGWTVAVDEEYEEGARFVVSGVDDE